MTGQVDQGYFEVTPPGSLAERMMIRVRDRIQADFLRICRPLPHETILDIGVSDVIGAAANVLERRYPRQHRLTAAGLEHVGSAENQRRFVAELLRSGTACS